MKAITMVSICLMVSNFPMQAQTTYLQTFGGPNADWPMEHIQTNDNSIALVGSSWSYGHSMCIQKLDRSGTTEWSRFLGGPAADNGKSIVQAEDNGYLIGGTTTSFRARFSDCLITKYTSTGDLEWSKKIGGAGWDVLNSLIRTNDGGYAFAGYSDSFSDGYWYADMYLVKLDAMGAMLWSNTYRNVGNETAESLVQTRDGGYLLAGNIQRAYYEGFIPIDSKNPIHGIPARVPYRIEEESSDMLVIKIDQDGLVEWTTSIEGLPYGTELCNAAIQTQDGGYALCGSTNSYGAGGADLYVVKLDERGSLEWTRTVGGVRGEAGYAIIQTTESGYIACGYTNSFGAGGDDMYVVKLKQNGDLEWSKTIGGPENDVAQSIVLSTDGSFTVAGRTSSFGSGSWDIMIAQLDPKGTSCHSTNPSSEVGSGGQTAPVDITKNSSHSSISKAAPTEIKGGIVNTICTE